MYITWTLYLWYRLPWSTRAWVLYIFCIMVQTALEYWDWIYFVLWCKLAWSNGAWVLYIFCIMVQPDLYYWGLSIYFVFMVQADLEYWGLSMFTLHPCCYARFFQRLEATAEDVHIERSLFKRHLKRQVRTGHFGFKVINPLCFEELHRPLWY